jgi:hypothetical protein
MVMIVSARVISMILVYICRKCAILGSNTACWLSQVSTLARVYSPVCANFSGAGLRAPGPSAGRRSSVLAASRSACSSASLEESGPLRGRVSALSVGDGERDARMGEIAKRI